MRLSGLCAHKHPTTAERRNYFYEHHRGAIALLSVIGLGRACKLLQEQPLYVINAGKPIPRNVCWDDSLLSLAE